MAIQFSRETKVFVEIGSDIWEIPVLDGFSFSQATNSTEVTLAEMAGVGGTSRRGRKQFTDSVAPAEWSLTTYVRPYGALSASNNTGAVEEVLWACMVANNPTYTAATKAWSQGLDKTTDYTTLIDFADSNYTSLKTFNLWFVLGACSDTTDITYTSAEGFTIYKIASSCVDTATVNFDIEGIAAIDWTGYGSQITEEASFDTTGKVVAGIANTNNFIRNRLTSLTIASSTAMQTTGFNPTYSAVLTGGSIVFSNNLSFLTPETLCQVNTPLEHVTGTRSITGNFTAYLDTTAGSTAELFNDMQTYNTEIITDFDVSFIIGGTGNDPRVTVNLAQCHFEIPQHSIEDVISFDVNFHGLPTDLDSTDEATVTYYTQNAPV